MTFSLLYSIFTARYRHLTRTIKILVDRGIIIKMDKKLIIADRPKLQVIAKDIYA